MNKKSIKKANYKDKNGFITLKKYLRRDKVYKYWINKLNHRIAMSVFKYYKSKYKLPNWRL